MSRSPIQWLAHIKSCSSVTKLLSLLSSCRRNGKFLTVPFDKLDFGETSVLETFSNADVAIVDMTSKGQAALSYHVGVRHSLGMKDNFMLFRDENPEETISMKVSFIL